VRVDLYKDSDEKRWDDFCDKSDQATFLHKRKYVSYHGDRFRDLSLLITENNSLLGLFVAAESPYDSNCVVSHPGLTYGGLIHDGVLRGDLSIKAFRLIIDYYKELNYRKLLYKAVPFFYHKISSADDIYALQILGATRYRCDLSSVIRLGCMRPPSSRRARCLKKSSKLDIQIEFETSHLPEFWGVLSKNLYDKFGASPTHSLDEITYLSNIFPENIRLVTAHIRDELVAGVVVYVTSTCMHAQYIASTPLGNSCFALDLIFNRCIEMASAERKIWFNFGISNEQEGKLLNHGLYEFKSEFGGGGAIHEFYEMNL
jgi:hypothetical protein